MARRDGVGWGTNEPGRQESEGNVPRSKRSMLNG